jgi:hypothetical protein
MRVAGQRWCRACLTAYQRERREQAQLAKRAPELLRRKDASIAALQRQLDELNRTIEERAKPAASAAGLSAIEPDIMAATLQEAVNQLEQLLRGIGAMSQPPQCCRDAHMRVLPCRCACHGARAWLESVRI